GIAERRNRDRTGVLRGHRKLGPRRDGLQVGRVQNPAVMRASRFFVPAMLLSLLAGRMLPASAHTNIVIAGFQIAPGGYVNGLGVVPNQDVRAMSDSPATDGTEVWTNLDPVAHRLTGVCVARPR